MKCDQCACWEQRLDNKDFGYCKARAPRPTVMDKIDGLERQIIWPSTGKDDHCVKDFVKK